MGELLSFPDSPEERAFLLRRRRNRILGAYVSHSSTVGIEQKPVIERPQPQADTWFVDPDAPGVRDFTLGLMRTHEEMAARYREQLGLEKPAIDGHFISDEQARKMGGFINSRGEFTVIRTINPIEGGDEK